MTAFGDRDEPLQQMLLALCLEAGADDSFRRDPRAFAARFGVDERDASTLATDGRRLPLYRRLVRSALGGAVRDVLGPFVPRLEADAPGLFPACLDAFLAGGLTAPLLRDVPRAFLEGSRARIAGDARVASWLLEAADAICTEHEVGAAANVGDAGDSELALDRGLRFAPAVALRRYAFAVPDLDLDQLAAPPPSRQVPEERSAAWLATRDGDDAVGWRELSPAAGAFLDLALGGATLSRSMEAALGVGAASAADVQQDLAQLLTGLAAEGALLGGAD